MANLDEEDIIEDDSFRTVLSFSPEVQEAIDQVSVDLGHVLLPRCCFSLKWVWHSGIPIMRKCGNAEVRTLICGSEVRKIPHFRARSMTMFNLFICQCSTLLLLCF